ncbi:hypothetical protein D9611_000661 [Ephemerocybe angulata]|uniref:Zn(2)-C6 fungal-type domain-containing protein n=1 Tax=Ephemerocybe angulata TaxID=980116 RepID=A0A8H5F6X3_9AGAR|nr:hypothetical protein D9611_000661 [Tulosesus angulatus]
MYRLPQRSHMATPPTQEGLNDSVKSSNAITTSSATSPSGCYTCFLRSSQCDGLLPSCTPCMADNTFFCMSFEEARARVAKPPHQQDPGQTLSGNDFSLMTVNSGNMPGLGNGSIRTDYNAAWIQPTNIPATERINELLPKQELTIQPGIHSNFTASSLDTMMHSVRSKGPDTSTQRTSFSDMAMIPSASQYKVTICPQCVRALACERHKAPKRGTVEGGPHAYARTTRDLTQSQLPRQGPYSATARPIARNPIKNGHDRSSPLPWDEFLPSSYLDPNTTTTEVATA